MSTIHQLVTDQFAPVAASYTTSATHNNPNALSEIVRLVQPRPTDAMLDVATGAGHVALTFAPLVASVVAYDLTPAMLEETAKSAESRGLANVETVQGKAEELPFPDETFDIYTVRLAPHHFADIRASIREAARVLKPGGRYLVADTSSPEDDALDQEIDKIERMRDPSHVRNYRVSEWRQMVEEAGLEVTFTEYGFCDDKSMDLEDWMTRMRTPADSQTELRRRFREASEALAKELDIVTEGDAVGFRLPRVTLLAVKN